MNTRSYPASVPRLVPGSRWRRRGADSRSSSGGYRGGPRGSRAASLPPAKASSCPPNSDPCRLGATAMLSRSRYSRPGQQDDEAEYGGAYLDHPDHTLRHVRTVVDERARSRGPASPERVSDVLRSTAEGC